MAAVSPDVERIIRQHRAALWSQWNRDQALVYAGIAVVLGSTLVGFLIAWIIVLVRSH